MCIFKYAQISEGMEIFMPDSTKREGLEARIVAFLQKDKDAKPQVKAPTVHPEEGWPEILKKFSACIQSLNEKCIGR